MSITRNLKRLKEKMQKKQTRKPPPPGMPQVIELPAKLKERFANIKKNTDIVIREAQAKLNEIKSTEDGIIMGFLDGEGINWDGKEMKLDSSRSAILIYDAPEPAETPIPSPDKSNENGKSEDTNTDSPEAGDTTDGQSEGDDPDQSRDTPAEVQ